MAGALTATDSTGASAVSGVPASSDADELVSFLGLVSAYEWVTEGSGFARLASTGLRTGRRARHNPAPMFSPRL